MKICTKCNGEKLLDNFFSDSSKQSGYCSQCKSCHQHYKKIGHKQKRGVYGIFSADKCLYIGESGELRNRIWVHKSNLKKITTNVEAQRQMYIRIRDYSNIEIKVLEETDNHKEQEKVWINRLNPLYL